MKTIQSFFLGLACSLVAFVLGVAIASPPATVAPPAAARPLVESLQGLASDDRVTGFSLHEGCGDEDCFVDVEFRIVTEDPTSREAILSAFGAQPMSKPRMLFEQAVGWLRAGH